MDIQFLISKVNSERSSPKLFVWDTKTLLNTLHASGIKMSSRTLDRKLRLNFLPKPIMVEDIKEAETRNIEPKNANYLRNVNYPRNVNPKRKQREGGALNYIFLNCKAFIYTDKLSIFDGPRVGEINAAQG